MSRGSTSSMAGNDGTPGPGRIFIVGVPRSGTTLLQSLLAAHRCVTSFTESHFFSRHYRFLRGTAIPFLAVDPRPRLREFLAENGIDPETLPRDSLLSADTAPVGRARRLLHRRAAARDFIELLDRTAATRGASHWVEKTPMHLRYIDFIESLTRPDGEASFVHLIRDGLEVVASLRRASRSWERAYDVRECAERWNDDMTRSLGWLGAPRHHVVAYEELAAGPEETLRKLLPRLGLEWEPGILESYGGVAAAVVTEDEAWKEGVGRPIAPSGTAARSMTGAERAEAESILRQELYEQLRSWSVVSRARG